MNLGKTRDRIKLALGLAFGVGAFALLAPAGAAATPISYTFPAGNNQGWVQSQGEDPPVITAGDAATGALSITDTGSDVCAGPGDPCQFAFFASPLNLGNLSANYGGTLSLDFTTSVAPDFGLGVDIFGPGNTSIFTNFLAAGIGSPAVNHLSTTVTETNFLHCAGDLCNTASQAQVKAVLAAVNDIEVYADIRDGTGETYTLDNVALTDGPPPPAAGAPTGQRAAALKKCAKIKKNKAKKKKCKKRAKALPN